MGLKKLFLITVLAGAMSALGCGDDDSSSGNGNGGTPDPSVRCNRGICINNSDKKAECEQKVQTCIDNEPEANLEECIIGVVGLVCESI